MSFNWSQDPRSRNNLYTWWRGHRAFPSRWPKPLFWTSGHSVTTRTLSPGAKLRMWLVGKIHWSTSMLSVTCVSVTRQQVQVLGTADTVCATGVHVGHKRTSTTTRSTALTDSCKRHLWLLLWGFPSFLGYLTNECRFWGVVHTTFIKLSLAELE